MVKFRGRRIIPRWSDTNSVPPSDLQPGEIVTSMPSRTIFVGTEGEAITLPDAAIFDEAIASEAQAREQAIAPLATTAALSQAIASEAQARQADLADALSGNGSEDKRLFFASKIAALTGRGQQEAEAFLGGDDLGQSSSLQYDAESLVAWGLATPNFDSSKLGDLQALAAQTCIHLYLGGLLGFLQELEEKIAVLAGTTPLANSVLVRQFGLSEWESGAWSAPGGYNFSRRLPMNKLLIPSEQADNRHHYIFICLSNVQTAIGYGTSGAWSIRSPANYMGQLFQVWISAANTATSAPYKMGTGHLYASAPLDLLAYAKHL